MRRPGIPRSPWFRVTLVLPFFALSGLLIWWRGPDWGAVYHAFDFVEWRWIVVAVVLNLGSIVVRALAWQLVLGQALDPPLPRFRRTFSAFCVGLLGNAALPGRVGELARVAVLRRTLPHGRGTSATLLGAVIAHRLFDLVPVAFLVLYVLSTAQIPHWAMTSLLIVAILGAALFAFAIVSARRHHRAVRYEMGRLRAVLSMARQGLLVMNRPVPAAGAILCQTAGWLLQLAAVYTVMNAFDFGTVPEAALVLLLMNVATIVPLWPGNFGLMQAAVALPLTRYGVAYSTGFAFGLALQGVEASVGIGFGFVFLAREGLSFATLRGMPDATGELPDDEAEVDEEPARARAGVSG